MERKDLLDMASKAGFGKLLTGDGLPAMWHGTDIGMLEHFAWLVAAAERDACKAVTRSLNIGPQDGARWEVARTIERLIDERSNAEITGRQKRSF